APPPAAPDPAVPPVTLPPPPVPPFADPPVPEATPADPPRPAVDPPVPAPPAPPSSSPAHAAKSAALSKAPVKALDRIRGFMTTSLSSYEIPRSESPPERRRPQGTVLRN